MYGTHAQTQTGIFFGHGKKGVPAIWYNMDEPGRHM